MALPGNGIFVVKGEMSLLMTAMKRGTRWSTHSHQDEEVEPLMKSLQELKDILNKIDDLKTIEPLVFLGPFLDVIRSEDTTGPITSLALSSINKFLSYGLIDPVHQTIAVTVQSIADAVTHARFVGTDQSSDGVVLMKILQVLRTLTLAPEGISLTDESLCQIMLACFNICFETKLSELLRKTAEHYLKDMVHLVFMRLPQFQEVYSINYKQLKMRTGVVEPTRTKRRGRNSMKNKSKPEIKYTTTVEKPTESEDNSNRLPPTTAQTPTEAPTNNIIDMQGSMSQSVSNPDSLETSESNSLLEKNENEVQDENGSSQTNSITTTLNQLEELSKSSDQPLSEDIPSLQSVNSMESIKSDYASQDPNEQINQEYVNPRGIRFTSQALEDVVLVPYSLASIRELFRFLISLCNPQDKQNTDIMIHLGLTLLTVAFEVGADSIGKYSILLSLVKDELCRNLFSLLTTDRIFIFAADLQLCFLMFESMRSHLKFQLELYLTKLTEIIVSDSVKATYEHKEIALDNILHLWRIPGFVTELYLNYDCNFYCTNLYEDLTKLLAKNAFSVTAGVYPTNLLSLDALLTVIESIEAHCNEKVNKKSDVEICKSNVNNETSENIEKIDEIIGKASSRIKVSDNVPTREELLAIKNIKKWLPTGTEYFNHKPKKGIQFLQEHGVLKPELDPNEVVTFLRENPGLDKKMIGEFISSRNNLQILETFVKGFDFTDTRIDEALRLYLETFRLPGEAPLISLIMEHFAEHWHKCNGEPFANADAAFTLAYAVIMLNVDQHNHNVKKQNNPMTAEEFKKNLKKVNGGADFDQDMLDEIYISIRSDEIVMPAEQTGLVRENYIWKVLQRRGASKDGVYIHVQGGTFDKDLFALIWGPIVSALSFVYEKSEDINIYKKAMLGFERCAYISSHYNVTKNLDMLILSLCKFTMLHNQTNKPNNNSTNLTVQFGMNIKAQVALRTVFSLTHNHGDTVREGWKNIFDLLLTIFSLGMLPKSYTEVEDFIEPSGQISLLYENVQLQKQESSLFSSLYSYMVSSENLSRIPTPEEQEFIDIATQCIKECNIDQLVTDSKFLHEEALIEMVNSLVELSRGPDIQKSLGYNYNESVAVFFLELLVRVVIQNRDRVMTIWHPVRDHLYTLVMNASHCDYQFLLERSVIGLLRLAIRLMRNEDMSPIVLQSVRMLLLLKSGTLFRISRQISFGLYELLKTSAQNIHTNTDWSIIFTLLECVGAGAQPPKPVGENQTDQGAKSEGEGPLSSEEESPTTDRGYTSDSELAKSPRHNVASRSQSPLIAPVTTPNVQQANTGGWILVGNEGEVQPVVGRTPPANQYSLSLDRNLGPHDPSGLVKCCESLAFLVRDVAHITPYNFDDCVHCIRTFVEASLREGKRKRNNSEKDAWKRKNAQRKREGQRGARSPAHSNEDTDDEDELPSGYHQVSIQLLDLMHTLHTRTAQIFRWWAEEGGEIAQEVSLWTQGWCPLLQGIARLCCDIRRQVRMSAITYLQRALLVHDLQTLTGPEWEACFHRVLFPLLSQLLQPIGSREPSSMEETRIRAATVLSKVFLHHLTPLLTLTTFPNLWLIILDFMDKYMHAEKSDLLYEAIPESLKNMLLVMDSAKVFEGQEGRTKLWDITWDRINKFLPHLKEELFREQEEKKVEKVQSPPPPPPVEAEQYPKTTISVTQHNIENATRSSIILQPPSSQNNIKSPLFAHLGQMVSTPISVSPPEGNCGVQIKPTSVAVAETPLVNPPAPISIPLPTMPSTNVLSSQQCYQTPYPITQPIPNILSNIGGNNQGHTFPILYSSNPQITTAPTEVQPVSLYSEYIGNPYNNIAPIPTNPVINDNYILQTSQSPTIEKLSPQQSLVNSPIHIIQNANVNIQQQTPEKSILQPPSLLPDFNVNHGLDNNPAAATEFSTMQVAKNTNNFFQSSNYFNMSRTQGIIPPGSEILFGEKESSIDKHSFNIPSPDPNMNNK